MIRRLQQGMKEDGFEVPMTKLCRWFEVLRRTVYYRPFKSAPKIPERFAAPSKQLIEADPSFGYRHRFETSNTPSASSESGSASTTPVGPTKPSA